MFMKKEHWLYIVIAALVIWIIASYAVKSKNANPGGYGTTTSQAASAVSTTGTYSASGPSGNVQPASAVTAGTAGVSVMPINSGSQIETSAPNQTGVAGQEAGPNKGVLTSPTASNNSIMVNDQAAGGIVMIAKVSLAQDGWVAIHEQADGKPGRILGAQRFDMGVYSGGQVELLRDTMAGNTYYAMIHIDDGDKIFDPHVDLPVIGSDGQPVMVMFKAN